MNGVVGEDERWPQIEALLDATLDLPVEAQGALLDDVCRGEPQLRARVEALLAADREAGDFLAHPDEDAAALLAGDAEPAPVGESLGPYRLIREIGAGGMGVVYEAVHSRLRRRAAIKLLPRELHADPAARERLLREARAAAALDDPHICGVHDLGESDGRLYMVMPLCEGETLKEKLGRGPLPVSEARTIAIQVARALVRAHGAGIIHRDLKPANVMIDTHGVVKLLDFGIAKVRGDPSLTRRGDSLGTPAYMSPEQVHGDAVDARTDVWGLGVLLYELLAGRRAFEGEDDRAVLHAILEREPVALEHWRPEVPPALARVVAQAMAKDRELRYPDAAALLADLEADRASRRRRRPGKLAAIAAVVVAMAAGIAALWCTPRPAAVPPSPPAAAERRAPTVAVLPFANRTGRPELDWYGGAMARLVMDALSSSRHVRVASEQRAAALIDAAGAADLNRAAAIGIDAVLTGELLPSPRGLRVGARLTHVRESRVLAAFERDGLTPATILGSRDDLALAARRGLGVPPGEQIGGLAADFLARNPEAYGDYARGLSAFLRFQYPQAEPSFREALKKAPDFTMARYRLAQLQYVTSRTDEALVNIRQAVAEAGGLPEREARYVRAGEALFARRTDEAITAYQELARDYPYETEARFLLAQALISRERNEEALAVLAVLQELEPESPLAWTMTAEAQLALRRTNEALTAVDAALARDPEDVYARYLRSSAFQALGELELARGELEEILRRRPNFHAAEVALAEIDVLSGSEADAERRLAAMAADVDVQPRYRITAALDLAWLYRAQGRFAAAERVLVARRADLTAEGVREATALTVRGLARLDRGDLAVARRLLDEAVARSASNRQRHLCALAARGLVQLREKRWREVEDAAREIRGANTAADTAQSGEEKAAAYLLGLRWLGSGRTDRAVGELSRAVALHGHECGVYRLDLARAYLAAGRLPEALAAARQAAEGRDPAEPRFDLELDRVRALLVVAHVELALGRRAEAAAATRRFLQRWKRADPGLPELVEAQRLSEPSVNLARHD